MEDLIIQYIPQAFEMIKTELFVLIPVIWYLGMMLKKSEYVKNKAIPFVLLLGAVLLCVGWFIINGTDIVQSAWVGFVQGVLIAMCADYGFNLKKNALNKE